MRLLSIALPVRFTLRGSEQVALQTFLNTLALFPLDDTPSTLDPGDPNKPGFPQFGHGCIKVDCAV